MSLALIVAHSGLSGRVAHDIATEEYTVIRRKLSETDTAVSWLKQFDLSDQELASLLLDSMVLVSRDDFFDRLSELVRSRAASFDGRVGLYTERDLHKYRGKPNRLFKETLRKPRRSYGAGPVPIKPARTLGPEVGSEGLVGNLITELCRLRPNTFRSHPGPDEIRHESVRGFILVTDFIGSGDRACTYLEAAWQNASVKSWRSLGLMRFEVIAYSAADKGVKRIQKHRSRPHVSLVTPCPTIDSVFRPRDVARVKSLCARYDPVDHDPLECLGYGGIGALIAFAHGCPNNAPRILHRAKPRHWDPLFPARVTQSMRGLFGDQRDTATLAHRLARLGESRLAVGPWLRHTTQEGRLVIALLAAVRRGPRRNDTIARRTGLTLPEVAALIERVTAWGWIDVLRRLTDEGHRQLRHARRAVETRDVLALEPEVPYYPTSLRAPRSV